MRKKKTPRIYIFSQLSGDFQEQSITTKLETDFYFNKHFSELILINLQNSLCFLKRPHLHSIFLRLQCRRILSLHLLPRDQCQNLGYYPRKDKKCFLNTQRNVSLTHYDQVKHSNCDVYVRNVMQLFLLISTCTIDIIS